ncbi:putative ATP-grasp-modified RiPP [Streptomyces sp. NPDC046161]|uniref:putative ATP-grasp-modified RiPP n=1 Tax=Streptomyces sp. NPDC046161 TaxID=3155132 RepID=UPI0033C58A7D
METPNHSAPWGTTRMAPYAETDVVPLLTPVIDPDTQVAVITDECGRTVELGDHLAANSLSNSTSTTVSSSTQNSTSTSGPDSYDSDSNSDSDTDSDSDHSPSGW